jgi:hypothetical protein
MLCWFYKFIISHVQDKGGSPSGITEKHIRHCSDCRRFFNTCRSLNKRLTQEAAVLNKRLPKRMSQHILSAINDQGTRTHKVRMKFWVSTAAACLALIVLIGALLLLSRRDNRRDNIQPGQLQMGVAIQELRKVYDQVGRDLPATWPQLIERPLAGEYEKLTNDTQSAVRFLAACINVDVARVDRGTLN